MQRGNRKYRGICVEYSFLYLKIFLLQLRDRWHSLFTSLGELRV